MNKPNAPTGDLRRTIQEPAPEAADTGIHPHRTIVEPTPGDLKTGHASRAGRAEPGSPAAFPAANATATSSASATQPIAGAEFGTYRLIELLGEGGMGAVWKGIHTKLKKTVAVKVLPVHLTRDPRVVARFEREMEAVGKLDHPNIVRAMDAGVINGTHFLVMEFVDGSDLGKVVEKRGQRSIKDACELIRQAAVGLEHAHQHKLVHRDIKPSNLLLSKQGKVKILDLGLARLQEDVSSPEKGKALTGFGMIMGTPDYMAPEQWEDLHSTDHRADLYALGCTLFFLLTGRAPFDDAAHQSLAKKLAAHTNEPAPDLIKERPEVSPELSAIYRKLLEKDPAARFASAGELAKALSAVAKGQPTGLAVPDVAHPSAASSGTTGSSPTAVLPLTIAPGATAAPVAAPATVPIESGLASVLSSIANDETAELTQPRAGSRKPPADDQQGPRSPNQRTLWIAGGALFGVLVLGGIIIKITTRDGKTAEIKLPDGAKVEITNDSDEPKVTPSGLESAEQAPQQPGAGASPPQAVAPFDAKQARAHQEAWAKHLGVPVHFTNSLGMQFFLIPPGEFQRGLPQSEYDALVAAKPDEALRAQIEASHPQHRTVITRPYYLGLMEVMQKDFQLVTGRNPSYYSQTGEGAKGVGNRDMSTGPVENVTWGDAVAFCLELSKKEQLTPSYSAGTVDAQIVAGTGYRLPTEAEWEFGCRAGTTTPLWFDHTTVEDDSRYGWFSTHSDRITHWVGAAGNPFGIAGMHGNVREWCHDRFDPAAYSRFRNGGATDPNGEAAAAMQRVQRGGDILTEPRLCSSGLRSAGEASKGFPTVGIRLVLPIESRLPARPQVANPPGTPAPIAREALDGIVLDPPIALGTLDVGTDLPNTSQHHIVTELPAAYRGATYTAFDGMAGRLKFTVTRPMTVRVAFWDSQWGGVGNAQGDWRPELKNKDDLAKDGWKEVARFKTHYAAEKIDYGWIIYERACKADEQFLLRNGKYRAPILVLPKSTATGSAVGSAPPAAVAPFDAKQARAHQEAWAKHLGVPVEFTNSVGMKLVLIPPGDYVIGSTKEQVDVALKEFPTEREEFYKREAQQRREKIDQPFLLAGTELTQGHWEAVMGTRPWEGKRQVRSDPNCPATHISYADALAFCQKLSEKEGRRYRLPKEIEWEIACRGGTATTYHFGDSAAQLGEYAWFRGQAVGDRGTEGAPRPVALKKPNPFGLHDMMGNVFEGCIELPGQPAAGLFRGGNFEDLARFCRSAMGSNDPRDAGKYYNGFRIAAEAVPAGAAPAAAVAPFDAKQARAHQEAWAKHLGVPVEFTNSIGMKFMLLPPGKFVMGGTPQEIEERSALWAKDNVEGQAIARSEGPQHSVQLTKAFYLGIHEVTQKQYKDLIGDNPSTFRPDSPNEDGKRRTAGKDTSNHPIESVSWALAGEFCRKLTEKERLLGTAYRLPTDAEWEYGCRAGTESRFWTGDSTASLAGAEWVGQERTTDVGSLKPNPFGLFDMHGNVSEWAQDFFSDTYYGEFAATAAVDPQGPKTGQWRSIRGGEWYHDGSSARAANRSRDVNGSMHIGFRLVLPVDAVKTTGIAEPNPARRTAAPSSGAQSAAAHPGMVGRILIDGKDAKVLATYASGKTFGHKIVKLIIPSYDYGKQKIQIELNGVLQLDAAEKVRIRHAGGSATGGVATLFVDDKPLGAVGGEHDKESTYEPELAKGPHTFRWVLTGGWLGSANLLEVAAADGRPLPLGHTDALLAAARKDETKKQAELTGEAGKSYSYAPTKAPAFSWKLAAERPAVLKNVSFQPIPLDPAVPGAYFPSAPEKFTDGDTVVYAGGGLSNTVTAEVETDGFLFVAINYEFQGANGDWEKTRWSGEQFAAAGWTPVSERDAGGKLVNRDQRTQSLLVKFVRKGEKLKLQCNRSDPPYLIHFERPASTDPM